VHYLHLEETERAAAAPSTCLSQLKGFRNSEKGRLKTGCKTARNEAGKAADKLQLFIMLCMQLKNEMCICIYGCMVQQESVREKDGNTEGKTKELQNQE
jgi:hypothetical protein